MATARPKEKSAVGKEKVLPSNPQSSTSTKKTTKPYTPNGKPTSTSSSEKEKQIPNYLKATVSSRVESHSPQKIAVNRRRSLDKPPSSSTLTKHIQSSSRLHKALVSPGPRERLGSQLRSLSSASEKTASRTPRDGKLSTNTKRVNISRKNSSPTPKKVARDGSITANSTKAPKSGAETKEEIKNVETEAEVKHAANEKVEEVVIEDGNKQEENENATDHINPPVVDTENEHKHKKEHEQDQVVEESKPGEPQIQADNNNNNNVIPTAPEEEQQQEEEEERAKAVSVPEEIKQVVEVEEVKKEDPPEEKAEDVHQEGENKSPEEIIDHAEPEGQKVDVEETEEENHNGVTEEMEEENDKEEEAKEEKAVVEGETDEQVNFKKREDDDHNVEKSEVKEEKADLKPKQQRAGVHGKKETTQVSNDVIEETATKLEKRTNKVRALAGAFQTVIDHQSK